MLYCAVITNKNHIINCKYKAKNLMSPVMILMKELVLITGRKVRVFNGLSSFSRLE